MDSPAEVALKLLQIKAIQLNPQKPFTWSSGLKSPIYCDNRTILSFPEIRKDVISAFATVTPSFAPVECIAGVATAGIPHGVLLADRLDTPFVYVRSKTKTHGQLNQIEGRLATGTHVLVIEDLISTGGSSLKAVEALRRAGAVVQGVLAIFSYGFETTQRAFREADCPFTTLTNFATLLTVAAGDGYISEQEREMLEHWKRDPREWSTGHS